MQNRRMLLAGMAALSCIIAGCSKASDAPADTSAAAAPALTDRTADASTIVAMDAGWMRNLIAKNVDSLMTYYTPDAVSYGFGPTPSTGSDQIRAQYTEMVKATVTNPKITPGAVEFSDDGTMAYDHGTYQMTTAMPGKKPTNESGAFLNVWRKVDGQWKLVVEMSTPVTAPRM